MLFGEYHHQIDEKGRVRIPAKLKGLLGENFMVTKGTAGCLFIFPAEEWQANLMSKFTAIPMSDLEIQRPLRKFFSSAAELEEDNQGRYLLPPNLRQHARIKKDIVYIGVANRAEIWAKEEYERYMNGGEEEVSEFDKALAALRAYGI